MIENIKNIISKKEEIIKKEFIDLENQIASNEEIKNFLDSFKEKYLVMKRGNKNFYSGKITGVTQKFLFNQMNNTLSYFLNVRLEGNNGLGLGRVERIDVLNNNYLLFDTEEEARSNSEEVRRPMFNGLKKDKE